MYYFFFVPVAFLWEARGVDRPMSKESPAFAKERRPSAVLHSSHFSSTSPSCIMKRRRSHDGIDTSVRVDALVDVDFATSLQSYFVSVC